MDKRRSARFAYWMLVLVCLIMLMIAGCGSNGEKAKEGRAPLQEQKAMPSVSPEVLPPEASVVQPAPPSNLVAEVDGAKLTKKQLDAETKKMMASIKDQVPAEGRKDALAKLRRQIRDGFIIRTLLTNEANRLKINVTDREIDEAIDQLKGTLPPGVTVEDVMKRSGFTKEKMRDEMRIGNKVDKLVMSQMGGKRKPTDKEIKNYFDKNKDKFKIPESVHVRHILIAKAPGDDEQAKAVKKSKAEDLRKQLLAGADFADLAQKNSDCPSKESGGDLGTFTRGQMVKPFEDAAFSQEVKVIGPVVETGFGYHIIQVLDRNSAKAQPLDDKLKEKIAVLLGQQKQQEAFVALIERLKKNARIIVYEK